MNKQPNSLCISLLMVTVQLASACGTEIKDPGSRSATKEAPAPVLVESDLVSGEEVKTKEPVLPAPAAPKKKAKKPPMKGWLDKSTGFRFVLLGEAENSWELADVETADFAVYIDMTKSEREEALTAKQQGEKAFIDFMLIIYPPAAAVAAVLTQVQPLLETLGTSGQRRPSLCERELGKGWHFPSKEVVSNAIEDGIVEEIPDLESARVWLVIENLWKAQSYDFTTGSVENDFEDTDLRGALCVARDHSVSAN